MEFWVPLRTKACTYWAPVLLSYPMVWVEPCTWDVCANVPMVSVKPGGVLASGLTPPLAPSWVIVRDADQSL
jgi:hypothetical protein